MQPSKLHAAAPALRLRSRAKPASPIRSIRSNSRLPMTTFADLGLSDTALQALRDVGYENPSPIQEQAIPPLLEGRDVIGQAQTGTGKTAAFGLPMLEYVDPELDEVQGLVPTLTRELCIEVTQALRAYGAPKRGRRAPSSAARRSARSRPSCAGGGQDRRGHRSAACWTSISRRSPVLQEVPLRGARRGRRDARPRLPGGRRADPHP